MNMTNTFRILLIMTLCLNTSCSIERTESEQVFEEVLGRNNTEVLQNIILFYDDFIEENYSGLRIKKGTHKFLEDIFEMQTQDLIYNEQKACKLLASFRESTLSYKRDFLPYKGVREIIEGTGIFALIKQNGEEDYLSFGSEHLEYRQKGEKNYLYLQDSLIRIIDQDSFFNEEIAIYPPNRTIEEELIKVQEHGYLNFSSNSLFDEAIDSIKHIYSKDDVLELKSYVEVKKERIDIEHWRLAEYLHEEYCTKNIDLNDYFLKRIIVFEIFVEYLFLESDCQK